MEKDKKIMYLRTSMLNSSRFVGKVMYLNFLLGTIAFIILTFFTDLAFTDISLYNYLMYTVLAIQFIALVFFTLKYLWTYKVRKRYMQLKVRNHFKKIFVGNVFKKTLVMLSLFLWLFYIPFGVIYKFIYREYMKFGVVFFPYDHSIRGFGMDPFNTGNPVSSIRGILSIDIGISLLVVTYGFCITIFLFCLIKGK